MSFVNYFKESKKYYAYYLQVGYFIKYSKKYYFNLQYYSIYFIN